MNIGYFDHRRLTKRFLCFLSGRYTTAENICAELGCEDISKKGARVLTAEPLPVDSHFSFDVTTTKMSLLPLEGRVRWCNKTVHGYRSGIAFDRELTFNVRSII